MGSAFNIVQRDCSCACARVAWCVCMHADRRRCSRTLGAEFGCCDARLRSRCVATAAARHACPDACAMPDERGACGVNFALNSDAADAMACNIVDTGGRRRSGGCKVSMDTANLAGFDTLLIDIGCEHRVSGASTARARVSLRVCVCMRADPRDCAPTYAHSLHGLRTP